MSKPLIVLLEDNAERAERMRQRLQGAVECELLVFRRHTSEMIAWLERHLAEAALISLDHDLELLADGGECSDPGCGRDVADFLAGQPAHCPIVNHIANATDAPPTLWSAGTKYWPPATLRPAAKKDRSAGGVALARDAAVGRLSGLSFCG